MLTRFDSATRPSRIGTYSFVLLSAVSVRFGVAIGIALVGLVVILLTQAHLLFTDGQHDRLVCVLVHEPQPGPLWDNSVEVWQCHPLGEQ